jgi:hypothetical protein
MIIYDRLETNSRKWWNRISPENKPELKGGVALRCHGSDTNSDAMASSSRKYVRQTASFDASRANSSFKMDVEEIIAVIAYMRRRKQELKKK